MTDQNDQTGSGDEELSPDTEVDADASEEGQDGNEGLDPDEEGEETDETVEVELEGKKYRVPADLKDRVWLHDDYTRKTQQLSEERRELETARTQHATATKEIVEGRAKLMVIDAQLERLAKTDWETVYAENPGKALQLQAQAQRLQQARGELDGELTKKEGDLATEAKRVTDQRIQQGNAILAKEIPGWGPKLVSEIGQFAMSELGLTPQDLGQVTDHRVMKALYLAYEGKKATSQRTKAQNHEKAQGTKPAATVGGKTAAITGLDDRLSNDEWQRRRNAQIQQKQKAGRR